ncbi:MAG: DUF4886 domain-containing protein [Sphingobacterium sp.]
MKKFLLYALFFAVSLPFATAQQESPKDDDTMKVLAIGNSFSEDALEDYLHELATDAGKKMIIGNLYIGGAPLELHLKNAHNNLAAYSYRKIGLDGNKNTTKQVSIEQALADENWDYISLQQVSSYSGKYEVVMQSLPNLWTYIVAHVHSDTRLVYHQTWAYQQDSNHDGFKNYQEDQLVMYDSIMSVTSRLDDTGDYAYVIPAGTAIQNGRTSSVGDHFTRDGYHLDLDIGRYTAALTWYGKLFDLNPNKTDYKPDQIDIKQAKIARDAARRAIRKPFKISKIRK